MQIDKLWKTTFLWWFVALAGLLYSVMLIVAIVMNMSHYDPFSTVEMVVVPIGAATFLALVWAALITNKVEKGTPDFARAWEMQDSAAQAWHLLLYGNPIGLLYVLGHSLWNRGY